jgi:hypothetical protein
MTSTPRTPSAAELRLQWITALDTAASAIEVALRARTLPPSFCAAEAQALSSERAWLETVVWAGPV